MDDVTTWLKTIAKHILPNISRSKGNQAMRFGQVTECNKRNILVQKLFPDPFQKNQNGAYLWINRPKF